MRRGYGHSAVRAAVASNPSTPRETRRCVVEDNDGRVRAAARGHLGAFSESLHRLAKDMKEGLRARVACNAVTAPEIPEQRVEDKHWKARVAAASDPKTSTEILHRLAKNENKHVREAVAGNPSAPRCALRHLVKDKSVAVRKQFKAQMIVLTEEHCLNTRTEHLFAKRGEDNRESTYEGLALWLTNAPLHEEAVAVSAR